MPANLIRHGDRRGETAAASGPAASSQTLASWGLG